MSFPLYGTGAFDAPTGLVLGVLLGVAFGFVLERAGFGRAANLAAQFYYDDNRVLKVMFSAIATTAVSIGLLSGAGLLELDLLTVPETFLGPQIAGGLLLGAGFVTAGYCPGTGVVGAASGRLDGLVTYAGVMVGTLLFGLAWPWVEGFYGSGAMGVVRLDELIGAPFALVAFGVFGVAFAAFHGAERLEAWLAARNGRSVPIGSPRLRDASLAGLAVAGLAGLVPLGFAPAPAQRPASRPPVALAPLALAEALVDDPTGLWVVDLRAPADCAAARVPGALCLPPDGSPAFVADLPPGRALVLYGADTLAEVPEAATAWSGPVYAVAGGFPAFRAAVLTAPALPEAPTAAQLADWRLRSALHGHFTGAETPTAAPVAAPRKLVVASVKKGGGC